MWSGSTGGCVLPRRCVTVGASGNGWYGGWCCCSMAVGSRLLRQPPLPKKPSKRNSALLRSRAPRARKGRPDRWGSARSVKKADVFEHPEAFEHVGLLSNGPPGTAGLPFIQSSEDL